MQQTTFIQKYAKQLGILIAVVVIALVVWAIFRARSFHVVSTDPGSAHVSTISPYFQINFNRTLATSTPAVSINNAFTTSVIVSGKSLKINLTVPLEISRYTIVVPSIADTQGHRLTNLRFSFTPKRAAASSLSAAQQQTILQQQSLAAPSQPPTFTGTDALIHNGVSIEQVQDFEQAVTNFAASTKTHFKSIAIDTNSVNSPPIDPNNPSLTLTINFTVSLDNATYKATLQYSGVTSAELFLYNPQDGSQVFDSGVLNS